MSLEEKRAVMKRVDYRLPKADMHVHISLALSVEAFVRKLGKGKTGELGSEFLLDRNRRYYKHLGEHHHDTYEPLSRVLEITPEELAGTTQAYLERLAREGAIYAELSNTFREGVKFEAQMEAIAAGIDAARSNMGIEARIVVTSIRDFGGEKAEAAAKFLAEHPQKYVTGFGLVGDESGVDFGDFERAFNIAWHEANLGLAPHVAEQYPANALRFLETLPTGVLDVGEQDRRRVRVGHLTTAHLSTDLMKVFADLGICVESCISSNQRIGLPEDVKAAFNKVGGIIGTYKGKVIRSDVPLLDYFDNAAKHPLDAFINAGMVLCLGSDNPLLNNTNGGKECSKARQAGATDEQLLGFTYNAVANANVEFATRSNLLGLINHYNTMIDTGLPLKSTVLGYSDVHQNMLLGLT